MASCYVSCLRLAREHGLESVAFPAISCGVYGFPAAEACAIAVEQVRVFQAEHGTPRAVIFACFSESMRTLYENQLLR